MVGVFPPEPQMLQKRKRQHRHQHVMVQTQPAAALKMVEAKFLLHLLVRLLACPTRFDGRRQTFQRDILGMVGQVVFAFATGASLAHQPSLPARQMLGIRRLRTIRDPDPQRGEVGLEIGLAAAPPRGGRHISSGSAAKRACALWLSTEGTGCLAGRPRGLRAGHVSVTSGG